MYPWLSTTPNLVFSPLGVYCALTMLHEAVGQEARRALLGLLGPGPDSSPLDPRALLDSLGELDELTIANAVWVPRREACEAGFLRATRDRVAAETLGFDASGVRQACDAWGAERTRGRIAAMISTQKLPPSPQAVLGNTVCFAADWQHGFLKSRPGHFYLLAGSRVQVPMQVGVFAGLRYFEDSDCRAVELPYAQHPISMVLIAPTAHGDDAVRALEAGLDKRWARIAKAQRPRNVMLTLPELSVRGGYRLSEVLGNYGLAAVPAEPSPISGVPELRVDEVLHEAFLSVDRRSIEATTGAAGTASDCLVMMIDRPFLFTVVDRYSGVILFLGRIENPAQEGA